jgi:hypothetical protein
LADGRANPLAIPPRCAVFDDEEACDWQAAEPSAATIPQGRFDVLVAQLNCRALRHPLVTFVLILCLCWQSLAQAGTAVALAEAEEVAHAAMHFHGEAHHHDADGDGGIHQDSSAASLQHLLDDACVFAPALVPGTRLPLMAPTPVSPADGVATAARSPFLDGLERPPRST